MSTTTARDSRFSLILASGDALDVRAFTVHERISALFSISVTAVSESPDLDFEATIGKEARFEIHAGLAGAVRTRVWTGICKEVREAAVEARGLSTYEVEIVPALWLACQRRNHRMFQLLSDVDIAVRLLSEWGIEPDLRLTAYYKKRKYRVQYGESDYAFVCRLLEDSGVSFFFTGDSGESRLVLSDAPETSDLRDPRIPFRDEPGDVDREHVTRVRAGRRVRPGRYTLRDHDYRRPPSYRLMASAAAESAVEQQLERFHYTPGAFLFESDRGDPTPAADDRGRYRTDEAEAAAIVQRRLEAERSEAFSCTFESNAVDLAPGLVFGMVDHPRKELGDDRRLLVVEARLHGEVGRHFAVEAEARSAAIRFRPPLVTPKPKTNGVESATVVGPAGEEIHTDEFGRVRVHFHWDRESRMNQNSSCWIHVSQPWGGTGYGGVNLPRIGQEVLVDFLGGDPDRPVVVGRLYTNLQKVPYPLPNNKTQSGWKSNSTNQTGGYNEIMFEDAAGQELLRMRAEKDHHKLVKNDEEHMVGRDRTRQVNRDESVTVGHDRTKQIGQTERVNIGQNQSLSVGVNRVAQIGNDDTTMVGHQHVVMITPPGEFFKLTNASTVMTSKKIVTSTGGGATATMEDDYHAFESREMWIKASDVVQVKTNNFHVFADAQILLQAGGSTIEITPSGVTIHAPIVKIEGNDVDIHGTSTACLRSDGTAVVSGGKTTITGKPIEIHGDGDVDVKGSPIMLNC
jgi:type VI secretion system secreted protein VgrG